MGKRETPNQQKRHDRRARNGSELRDGVSVAAVHPTDMRARGLRFRRIRTGGHVLVPGKASAGLGPPPLREPTNQTNK